MARSIQLIQQEILDSIASNEYLTGLNSTSKVAIWKLLVYVISFAIWTLEALFDNHKKEVDTLIYEQKRGTLPWYRTMALAFQYGFSLLPDTDKFDNNGYSDTDIANSKIIKYASVNESVESSRVILKIAGETSGVLSPIEPGALESFKAYVEEFRYAGVEVTTINYLPDWLFLNVQIKRDPLIMEANGYVFDPLHSGFLVNEALQEFMKELPFDGELRLSALVDKLQKVPGVKDATLFSAQSSWIDADTGDYGLAQPIFISTVPVSGYFEIPNFDNISYVV